MKKYGCLIFLLSSLLTFTGCTGEEEDTVILSDLNETTIETEDVTEQEILDTIPEESESEDFFTPIGEDGIEYIVLSDYYGNEYTIENERLLGYNQIMVSLYSLENNRIDIDVTCPNDSPFPKNQTLVIFQDGILSEFVINGMPCNYYDFEVEEELNLSLSIVPSFKDHLGVIDIVFFQNKDIPDKGSYLRYPIYFELQEEPFYEFTQIVEPIPVIDGYKGSLGLDGESRMVGCFPWELSTTDEGRWSTDMAVEIIKDSPFSVDLYCPNRHDIPLRTTFFVNNHPIEIEVDGKTYPHLEWYSSEDMMMRLNLRLPDMEEADHYFFRSFTVPVVPFNSENYYDMLFYYSGETEIRVIE